MAKTVVSTKFQVVIPKEVRDEAGLRKGQSFVVVHKGGVISLIPDRPLSTMKGFAPGLKLEPFREKKGRS